jgi:hypothetical protein
MNGEKIMNAITSIVTIVSLLLALAVAEDSTRSQVDVSSPSATRGASSRPLPPGCDDWECGSNHNETLVLDDEPMK